MPLAYPFCSLYFFLHPYWGAKDSFEPFHTDCLQELLAQRAHRSIKQRMLFSRNWMRQAAYSSGAHSLPFHLLLGLGGMGDKHWSLM